MEAAFHPSCSDTGCGDEAKSGLTCWTAVPAPTFLMSGQIDHSFFFFFPFFVYLLLEFYLFTEISNKCLPLPQTVFDSTLVVTKQSFKMMVFVYYIVVLVEKHTLYTIWKI